MTPADLPNRIAAGESQTLELKASFDKASIESLVAFANTQGGTVLVGVSDAGRVQGVTLGKETLNEGLGQIKAATSPALIPEINAHRIDGKTIVEIDIREFPVKPVHTRGRYYKRISSSNHALNTGEIANLYMQSLPLSWDAYEARGYTVNHLSAAKIQRFIRLVNQHGRFALDETDPHAALEKLNYLKDGQPTWAAVLLFAQEPIRHNVHIGRFKTPDVIIDDRQFTDTLFEVVEQAMKFIVSHISVAFEFDGSIQRKERFAYPLPALREALLNAVVHRSYTDPSDIQIKIFDDKITLFSPGTFYGGLTVAEIRADNYRSSLRNKLVAEGFYLVNAIEKYGSGFIRIRRALQDYPEVQFDIEEKFGGVMATFTLKSRPVDSGAPQVTQQVEQLLAVIEGDMTRQELMAALELKDRNHFTNAYLKPALAAGVIEMTLPDKPKSSQQKYRKTGPRSGLEVFPRSVQPSPRLRAHPPEVRRHLRGHALVCGAPKVNRHFCTGVRCLLAGQQALDGQA